MRITILWSRLSSYAVAFFRELANGCDVQIQLVYQPVSSDAPYSNFDLSFCDMVIEDSSTNIRSRIEASVLSFSPHSVLMCSWNFKQYMRIARKLKKDGSYIISTIDHQWEGRLKQYLGVAVSPWFLKSCIDNFLVAGDRQAYFSKKLGFKFPLYGLYAADTSRFHGEMPINDRDASFLFIGRLVSVKGIDILIKSYCNYRDICDDPWNLRIAGIGKMNALVKDIPGVEHLGFVQPDCLPSIMQQSRCFVIPSIWEPWGVVIHEAAASGLPIIASFACGATTMFVRDGVNGCVIHLGVEHLTDALLRISRSSNEQILNMSKSSRKLASLWSPRMLAQYVYARISEEIKRK